MHLAILMFHSLDQSGSQISVAPQVFVRQLSRLRDAGYTVLPLGEALRTDPRSARRIAALTFDDGYANVHQTAAPVLASFGWRATVFAVSDYVGRDNQWPEQAAFVPRAGLATWSQLHDLLDAGWEVGAHTRTHPDLTRLDPERLETEVGGSKQTLEDRLGRAVDLFAYPSGKYNARVRDVVRRHFRAACTTDMGWASASSAPDALERIEMWDFARPGAYRLLGSELMPAYVGAVRAARAVRTAWHRARRVGRASSGCRCC